MYVMNCFIPNWDTVTMPWVALVLAFIASIVLSCFACAGWEEKLEKDEAAKKAKERETRQKMLKQNSKDTGICIFESEDLSILDIAKTADFIINGYAFTSENNQIRVLNLNNSNKATVLDYTGEVLMTSMDDIEISIVKEYFERNKEFLREK